MATVSVSILGMGRVGASVALALRRYSARKDAQHTFAVTCADMRPGIREDAAKVGIDKVERDLFDAVRGRDVVVMALPYADVQTAYKEIGAQLRSGAVLLDYSPLKMPSLEWAKKHLTGGAHLVGIAPILNPAYLFDELDDTLHAHADLFDKGNMLLMPGASVAREAVELASDFCSLLGASPHFFDPAEYDSLVAVTEGLPAALGVAVFHMLMGSAGWADTQRVTNPSFGRLTHHLYDTHPDDLRDLFLNNRDALARKLDETITHLQDLRNALIRDDRAAIEAMLISASEEYSGWVNRRHSARWDEAESNSSQTPSMGGMVMGGLMGGFLSKRFGGKDKDTKS
jgi:prephenate dehydrogenase